MKVLNLQCGQQHSFEGWFASEGAFQSQLEHGLVECPMCTDRDIKKLPSAPRLNLSGLESVGSGSQRGAQNANAQANASAVDHSQKAVAGGPDASSGRPEANRFSEQAAFLKAAREVLAVSEDVGSRFADEARAMHYGDSESRSIRGQASLHEAVALLQEGIDILPLPALLKETLQ